MSELEHSLRHIVAALTTRRARFALVGGLAVSIRAEPRLTRDADLAVAVASDDEAEALIVDLRADGYRVVAAVEQERQLRLATVRLTRSRDDRSAVTDLLFASSGIEQEIVIGAEIVEVLPGLWAPVASVGHLIAMKALARDDRRRPADADDLAALAHVAVVDDWTTARAAARLITARGFDRGRDLLGTVTRLSSGASPFDLPSDPDP